VALNQRQATKSTATPDDANSVPYLPPRLLRIISQTTPPHTASVCSRFYGYGRIRLPCAREDKKRDVSNGEKDEACEILSWQGSRDVQSCRSMRNYDILPGDYIQV